MPSRIRHCATTLVGVSFFTLSVSSMACVLAPTDPVRIKQMMAGEIAFRLAIDVEQVPLNDISPPELHRPLALEEDCSGLASFHHSSGFSIAAVTQQHTLATMGKPHTAAGTGARYRGRFVSGRWPGAGVRPNFWHAPSYKRGQGTPGVDYSGYIRWPEYPQEGRWVAARPAAPRPAAPRPAAPRQAAPIPQRWPQYPAESALRWDPAPSPVRWSTMGAMSAAPPQQGFCRYEGVAVVLGHDSSSPVAVNFKHQCD